MIISSCGKEHTIIVKAINPVTDEPYVGHTLSILQCRSGAFEDKCKIVYEGVTNENGVDLINIRLKNNRRYRLFLKAPDDYCYRSIPSYNVDKDKDKQEALFEFAPCGYLKLKIENQNCLSPNDEIFYQRHWLSGGESTNGVTQYGCFQYDGNYFSVPMGQYKYTWDVKKNWCKRK